MIHRLPYIAMMNEQVILNVANAHNVKGPAMSDVLWGLWLENELLPIESIISDWLENELLPIESIISDWLKQ